MFVRHFLLLSSDELIRCCAAGTNECLYLRCHAFLLDGQVSAEWSRCALIVQVLWHGALETVWLLFDEAQQVGCL